MGHIPTPKTTTPMVIGTGYHRNSPNWEPTIGGQSLAWWRAFFRDTKAEHWYPIPDEGRRALSRAFSACEMNGWYLHFGVIEEREAFVIDRRARWGKRMRNGEFIDWQSGKRR